MYRVVCFFVCLPVTVFVFTSLFVNVCLSLFILFRFVPFVSFCYMVFLFNLCLFYFVFCFDTCYCFFLFVVYCLVRVLLCFVLLCKVLMQLYWRCCFVWSVEQRSREIWRILVSGRKKVVGQIPCISLQTDSATNLRFVMNYRIDQVMGLPLLTFNETNLIYLMLTRRRELMKCSQCNWCLNLNWVSHDHLSPGVVMR